MDGVIFWSVVALLFACVASVLVTPHDRYRRVYLARTAAGPASVER